MTDAGVETAARHAVVVRAGDREVGVIAGVGGLQVGERHRRVVARDAHIEVLLQRALDAVLQRHLPDSGGICLRQRRYARAGQHQQNS